MQYILNILSSEIRKSSNQNIQCDYMFLFHNPMCVIHKHDTNCLNFYRTFLPILSNLETVRSKENCKWSTRIRVM